MQHTLEECGKTAEKPTQLINLHTLNTNNLGLYNCVLAEPASGTWQLKDLDITHIHHFNSIEPNIMKFCVDVC